MREVDKYLKQISSVQRHVEEMQRIQRHVDEMLHVQRQVDELQRVQKHVDEMQLHKQVDEMQRIQRHVDEMQRAYSPIASSTFWDQESYSKYVMNFQTQIKMTMQTAIGNNSLIQNHFQQHIQPYFETFNKIKEYADLVAKVSGPILFKPALRDVFYSEYALNAALGQETALDAYFDSFEAELRAAPHSALSLEFYLGFLINLILFISALHSSNESETRLQSRFDRLEMELSSLTKQLEVANDSSYYIVDRTAILRVAPNTKSAIIDKLPPAIKVELLVKRKMWVKDQFFSSRDRVLLNGWVLKKCLYRINLKRP